MKDKLEARKVVVDKEQSELQKAFEDLKEKGADINRQISAIQNRFNGNIRVLNEIAEMLKEEPVEVPVEKKPSPPKSSDRVPVPLTMDRKEKK